jgi:hypothetical protein
MPHIPVTEPTPQARSRMLFQSTRCLIPADGFYEWTKSPADGARTPGTSTCQTISRSHQAGNCQRTVLRPRKLGASDELLDIVGSWGDTMDDARTLDHLRAFNRNGTMFKEVICRAD